MKKFLLVIALAILSMSFFVQHKSEQILWSKKQLKWKDFKATPDTVGPHAKAGAVTYSRLEQRYYLTPNKEIHFIIAAWFNPEKSWVKKTVLESRNSDKVLNHEQHHFDMCELYARKIRKYLSTVIFTDSTYKSQIKELFKNFYDSYRAEQNRYDSEVITRQALEDWTSSIDDEIKDLSKFKDTLLVVKMQ